MYHLLVQHELVPVLRPSQPTALRNQMIRGVYTVRLLVDRAVATHYELHCNLFLAKQKPYLSMISSSAASMQFLLGPFTEFTLASAEDLLLIEPSTLEIS